jgi:hypothetical protein
MTGKSGSAKAVQKMTSIYFHFDSPELLNAGLIRQREGHAAPLLLRWTA